MKPLAWLEIPLSGTQLIEASAGTGKTFTITTLVLRLLLERRLRIDQILVVTFTNAATAELKDRIRRRLRLAARAFALRAAESSTSDPGVSAVTAGGAPEDPQLLELARRSQDPSADRDHLLEALRNLDEGAVFTIHGFCQRVLTECAFESGVRFERELTADLEPLLREVVRDFWAQTTYDADLELVQFLDARRVTIESLLTLARQAVSFPDMEIEPTASAPLPRDFIVQFRDSLGELRRVWPRVRDEVCELVISAPGLNRTTYKPARVTEWIEKLDALLRDSGPGLGRVFPELEHLTPEGLRRRTKKGYDPPIHSCFEHCGAVWRTYQAAVENLGPWTVQMERRLAEFARREVPRRLERRSEISFDGLLHELGRALRDGGGEHLARRVRARHPVALIDEFQDTDPIQYEILRALFTGVDSALFLIGDPKQAIYGFRGADVFAYLGAVQDVGAEAWFLETNYRSDPSLIAAINTLFSRLDTPFLIPEIRFWPVRAPSGRSDQLAQPRTRSAPLQLLFVPRSTLAHDPEKPLPKRRAVPWLYRAIAADIARLLASGVTLGNRPVNPADIAVLTRTNLEAQCIQRELRAAGVPSVLQSDASVLDAEEALEVAWILRALSEPSNAAAVRRALATTILGVPGDEIAGMREGEGPWEEWSERFLSWHEEWERQGFLPAFRRLVREQRVCELLLRRPDGERRLTNVLHLAELLHDAASLQHLGAAGLLRWFDEICLGDSRRGQVAAEAMQVRLESDRQAVLLTTVHKSKGLEYGIVYCPFLWAGTRLHPDECRHLRYHDRAAGHRLKLDLRPPEEKGDAIAAGQREALAEALRLAYVAVTRAKHRAVVVCGAFTAYESSALAHLLHQPHASASARSAAERVHGARDVELIEDLQRLVTEANGVIEVVCLEEQGTAQYRPSLEPPRSLRARRARRRLDRSWRMASFSALIGGHEPPHRPDLAEAESEGRAEEPVPQAGPDPDLPLVTFPRGTASGNLLHGVLERLDFTEPSGIRALVIEQLERYGFSSAEWADPLSLALTELLQVPFGTGGLSLAQIQPERRLSEMSFMMPVGSGPALVSPGKEADQALDRVLLTPTTLAQAFAELARPPVPLDYQAQIGGLGFEALAGFLRGFVDLIFEHQGRWFIVDYKSNYLGATAGDYAPERLLPAMADHHYFLQYHLYTVALHRHLAHRLRAYDYDRHFGGVYYLFLRGMTPRLGDRSGVFFDRPARSLVEALSSVIAGTGGVSRRPQ